MSVSEGERFAVACPVPSPASETIQLAHGGGGRLMRRLIDEVFAPAFERPGDPRHDAAVLEAHSRRLAMTTDSYVVRPLFFPGGDIGTLAVYGTVNDLAMAGATPAYLTVGFILEEGLPIDELRRIVGSMREAAAHAGVRIVSGDTKVVDRGKGDRVFVNTSGVGFVREGVDLRPARVRPGDAVLLSGDVGRHGVAILSVREGLAFEVEVESDCASLAPAVSKLLDAGVAVHCLRDLTRGGLASALHEIAVDGGVGVEVDEASIGVCEAVAAACELLGLDPLYVANEGRMIAIVPEADVGRALQALREDPVTAHAVRIGCVTEDHRGAVVLRGRIGGRRLLDLLSGEQLPRIC